MNTAKFASSTPSELPVVTRRKLSELFSRDEITLLTQRSNLRGAWAVLSAWTVIAACFALLAVFPNPLTFVAVVIVLGGRQLALAIISHEATHRTLFRTPWLNDFIGDWLCARLIWNDLPRYRQHHLKHHTYTGTPADPDISLITNLPTTRQSLRKKFFRDLTGQTGVRRIAAQFLMDIGVYGYTVAAEVTRLPRNGRHWADYARAGLRNMWGVVLVNVLLASALAAAGVLWTYWAWVAAYLTTFSLFIRIRSIAEHACLEQSADMFKNTRTTRAGWLARMTVAPIYVNYHLEHHVMASVPFYRLPLMHKLMRARDAVPVPPGYVDVLRLAASR